jgi:16S rRNA (cytosine967-C5)-methyltransferase
VTRARSPDDDRTSARAIAVSVLGRVRRDAAYANLALDAALGRARGISAVERSLATELVYGVLRHLRLLEHAISRHARRPLKRLDPNVRDELQVAAYQVLMLERVPAYAAVDHAVRAIRRRRGKAPAGFANAVLRKLEPRDLTEGLPSHPVRRLAVQHSLPDDLAAHWAAQLGPEQGAALAAALSERAQLCVRINTLRGDRQRFNTAVERDGGRAQAGRWAPDAALLSGLPAPFSAPSFSEGLWTAQDEASQLVAQLAAPTAGEQVLDACSGLGGKALHLAALMGDRGRVLCLDRGARKLGLLAQHGRRLGATICTPLCADLIESQLPLAPGQTFDRVVLDAPCSGLGVLRRHPERKWRGELLTAVPAMAQLQRRLLDALVPRVRPGGALIYSVCTTTEEEGPDQVTRALARWPELALDPPPPELPGLDGGALRLWPHRHGTDGFFIARLRRA